MADATAERALCEAILAKTGDTVLSETLSGTNQLTQWAHVPEGDVFDPESGGQWYYHCHPREDGTQPPEHGHFHLFLRPEGRAGPVHHLIALSVDAHGRPLRLFTVNHWVVGGDWLPAPATAALLPRFDIHLARPGYLVNRWLTAMVRQHEDEIAALIHTRDARLAARPGPPAEAREDRALEVLSSLALGTGRAE
jgi:hypothetical protein